MTELRVLETERLRLEPLEPRHAELLFDGLADPRLYRHIGAAPPESVEALRARYERLLRRTSPDGREGWLNWAIWLVDERRYVGFVQATVREGGEALVAWMLFADAWGRGYGREAAAAMLAELKETHGVGKFMATVDPRNTPSVRLLEALGFEQVELRRDAEWIGGVLTDEATYARRA